MKWMKSLNIRSLDVSLFELHVQSLSAVEVCDATKV